MAPEKPVKKSKLKRLLSRFLCLSDDPTESRPAKNVSGTNRNISEKPLAPDNRSNTPASPQHRAVGRSSQQSTRNKTKPRDNKPKPDSSREPHESLNSIKDENQLERQGTIVSLSKVEVFSGESINGDHESSRAEVEGSSGVLRSGATDHHDNRAGEKYKIGTDDSSAAPHHVIAQAQVAGPHAESSFYISDAELADNDSGPYLLGPIKEEQKGKKCLVLDLDETLVHSSFKYMPQADLVVPVEIDNQFQEVYVIKRPGVDEFMRRTGELFEVVVFTASMSKYGNPLLDQLDIHNVVHHRLFRESCYNHRGNYVKNLSRLGRPLKDIIIIDNSPISYIFQPEHAIPVSSWFSDVHDNELLDMLPFLEDLAGSHVPDIGLALDVNI